MFESYIAHRKLMDDTSMGFFRFTTKPVMYYTYVLQSLTSGIFYIGQTNNLEDRLKWHNQNRNTYTKG